MKRLRDLFDEGKRRYLVEAITRRKSYYLCKFQCLRKREEIIRSYLESTKCRKLHLGSGGHLLDGWLNSDILELEDGMIFVDVRDRLPFDNSALDFIYSEHLLEHLEYNEGRDLLKECFRVLRRGGVLRISTPDLDFLMEFYGSDTQENKEYLKWASDVYWHFSTYSKALVVNNYFRSWGHKCIYDIKLLKDTCERIGFKYVKKQDVGESDFADLKGIERHGDVISERWNIKESLVIEARK